MKIIDLLNKIAKGEEVPKKIKYDTRIYEYEPLQDDYSYFMVDHYEYMLDNIHVFEQLNDEVEIIEEDSFEDIEELKIGYPEDNPSNKYIINEYGTKCYLTKHSRIMADKINELIKNQKKIIEQLKTKD